MIRPGPPALAIQEALIRLEAALLNFHWNLFRLRFLGLREDDIQDAFGVGGFDLRSVHPAGQRDDALKFPINPLAAIDGDAFAGRLFLALAGNRQNTVVQRNGDVIPLDARNFEAGVNSFFVLGKLPRAGMKFSASDWPRACWNNPSISSRRVRCCGATAPRLNLCHVVSIIIVLCDLDCLQLLPLR